MRRAAGDERTRGLLHPSIGGCVGGSRRGRTRTRVRRCPRAPAQAAQRALRHAVWSAPGTLLPPAPPRARPAPRGSPDGSPRRLRVAISVRKLQRILNARRERPAGDRVAPQESGHASSPASRGRPPGGPGGRRPTGSSPRPCSASVAPPEGRRVARVAVTRALAGGAPRKPGDPASPSALAAAPRQLEPPSCASTRVAATRASAPPPAPARFVNPLTSGYPASPRGLSRG